MSMKQSTFLNTCWGVELQLLCIPSTHYTTPTLTASLHESAQTPLQPLHLTELTSIPSNTSDTMLEKSRGRGHPSSLNVPPRPSEKETTTHLSRERGCKFDESVRRLDSSFWKKLTFHGPPSHRRSESRAKIGTYSWGPLPESDARQVFSSETPKIKEDVAEKWSLDYLVVKTRYFHLQPLVEVIQQCTNELLRVLYRKKREGEREEILDMLMELKNEPTERVHQDTIPEMETGENPRISQTCTCPYMCMCEYVCICNPPDLLPVTSKGWMQCLDTFHNASRRYGFPVHHCRIEHNCRDHHHSDE